MQFALDVHMTVCKHATDAWSQLRIPLTEDMLPDLTTSRVCTIMSPRLVTHLVNVTDVICCGWLHMAKLETWTKARSKGSTATVAAVTKRATLAISQAGTTKRPLGLCSRFCCRGNAPVRRHVDAQENREREG